MRFLVWILNTLLPNAGLPNAGPPNERDAEDHRHEHAQAEHEPHAGERIHPTLGRDMWHAYPYLRDWRGRRPRRHTPEEEDHHADLYLK